MVNPIYAKKTVDGIYVSKAIIVVVGLFWIEIAGFVGELVVYWFLKQTRYHNGQPGKLTELVEPGVELGGLLENQLGMQTQYHNGQRLTELIAGFAGEPVAHSSRQQTHFEIVAAAEPIADFFGAPAGHRFGPVLWVGKPFFYHLRYILCPGKYDSLAEFHSNLC